MHLRLLFCSALAFSTQALSQEQPWEKVSESDGIEVWKREIPNSKIMAFKGRKIVDAPISKVTRVLADNDIESKKRWIDMVKDFKIVKEMTPFEGISYSSYDLPFPVADRDFILHGLRTMDNVKNEIRFELHSVEHPDYPESASIGVRAQLFSSTFVLVPKEEGFKTEVTVEIQTDPKGSIPTWLVNFINKNWPKNTLSRLEIESKRSDIQHDKYVLETFEGAKAVARSVTSH